MRGKDNAFALDLFVLQLPLINTYTVLDRFVEDGQYKLDELHMTSRINARFLFKRRKFKKHLLYVLCSLLG